MLTSHNPGGEATRRKRRLARPPSLVLGATISSLAVMAFTLAGGCAQAEKAQYMKHLTAVVEPSADIPDEVIFTFNLDRKQLPPGAVAAGLESRVSGIER